MGIHVKPGPKAPKNRKTRYCPDCGKPGMVKKGRVRGKQRWGCPSCKFLTLYPGMKPPDS